MTPPATDSSLGPDSAAPESALGSYRRTEQLAPIPARSIPEKFLVAFSFAGEQRDLVRAVAEAVEAQLGRGSVFLDEWFEHCLAGADADLKLQEIYGCKCTLVVVCVSERYGGKAWTQAEHEAIRARQMQARLATDQRERDAILPIRVGEGEVGGILFNAIVPDIRTRPVAKAAELVIERLRLLVPDLQVSSTAPPPPIRWPASPPTLTWPMADHHGVRDSFGTLLTAGAPWRFLPVVGPSETGKSHITRQMLANTLPLGQCGIGCGRFDFKGGSKLDLEVGSFVQFLHVKLEPPKGTPSVSDYLSQILALLKGRAAPALLIFDTYEQAGEAQEWVEKQLLPNLLICPWLRLVIAGQGVPDASGAVWLSAALPAIQLTTPQPEDWFDFGHPHKPGLTLDFVRQVHGYSGGKASLLAQLLGPTRGAA